MKYAIETFGCKVNQYESAAINKAMLDAGFEQGELAGADIVIINSCAVTEMSVKKALHAVRAAKKSGALVLLCGCFPQAFRDEAAKCGADIVAGTGRRGDIPSLIRSRLACARDAADYHIADTDDAYEELGFTDFGSANDKTRAFIKIEDGCDRYCSYCIIPYARGKVRSRGIEDIADEAGRCAALGHKEIVLVGINLSRFGSDTGADLADAVKAASEPEGIVRVRLSSLEPDLMDEALIQKLSRCEKLCPHFHLSLQSGCDETLRRMNRRYTTEGYTAVTERLREVFPDCSITTDVMVGFAGETDEEFERSLSFVEKTGFARIHVFTYSIREGTAASKRTDHVVESKKALRYELMSALSERLRRRWLESLVGKTVTILVQKRTSEEFVCGLTPDYSTVRVYGSDAKRHDLISVRITSAADNYCIGEQE